MGIEPFIRYDRDPDAGPELPSYAGSSGIDVRKVLFVTILSLSLALGGIGFAVVSTDTPELLHQQTEVTRRLHEEALNPLSQVEFYGNGSTPTCP
jgi:hypothetical protein